MKFIFVSLKVLIFKIFWESISPDPLKSLRHSVKFNSSLEKSGEVRGSQGNLYLLESGNPVKAPKSRPYLSHKDTERFYELNSLLVYNICAYYRSKDLQLRNQTLNIILLSFF